MNVWMIIVIVWAAALIGVVAFLWWTRPKHNRGPGPLATAARSRDEAVEQAFGSTFPGDGLDLIRGTGKLTDGNRPANAGASKQMDRLDALGITEVACTYAVRAGCTESERIIVRRRRKGETFGHIARVLQLSPDQVRRAEKRAVDKIINHVGASTND